MRHGSWRVWVLTLAVTPLGGCFLLGEAALEAACGAAGCGDGWGFSPPKESGSSAGGATSDSGPGMSSSAGSGGATSGATSASSSAASGGATSGPVVSSSGVGASSSSMQASSSAASSSSSSGGAMPAVLVQGAGLPNFLAMHGGKIYWTRRGNLPITSANTDGTGLATVTSAQQDAWHIQASAEGVFWTGGITFINGGNGSGYARGRLAGAASDVEYAASLTSPRTILVHNSAVFVASNNSPCVRRFTLAGALEAGAMGCTPTPSLAVLQGTLWAFTTFGTYKSLAPDFPDAAIFAGSGGLNTAGNVVRVLSTPNAVFVSAADTDGGGIYSFNGVGATALVDVPTTVNPDVESHFAYDMALDGDWLYYTTQPRVSSGDTGSVFRINVTNPAAGPQNLLAPSARNQRRYGLVIDPPWVIFAQEQDIARIQIPQ